MLTFHLCKTHEPAELLKNSFMFHEAGRWKQTVLCGSAVFGVSVFGNDNICYVMDLSTVDPHYDSNEDFSAEKEQ